MSVDSVPYSKTLHNHGFGDWKTEPLPTGGSGTVDLTVPAMDTPEQFLMNGIPIAQGELLNLVNARLMDGASEIPSHMQVTKNHPDGSIASLWVGAKVAPDPVNTKQLQFAYGPDITQSDYSGSGLTVTDTASTLTIDTGACVWTIEKSTWNLLKQTIGGTDVITSGDIVMVNALDGLTYRASNDTNFVVEIEKQSAHYIQVKLTGQLFNGATGFFKFVLRFRFYAGLSYCDTGLRVIEDEDEPNIDNIEPFEGGPLPISVSDYRLELNCNAFTGYGIGTAAGSNVNGTIAGEHYIKADGILHYSNGGYDDPAYTFSFSGEATGEKATGWVSGNNATHHAWAMMRHFWETFPTEISIDSNGLNLVFLSTRGSIPDTNFIDLEDDPAQNYRRPNTMYHQSHGYAKTKNFRIGGGSGAPNFDEIDKIKSVFDIYQMGFKCSPQHYCDTGYFGEMKAQNAENASWINNITAGILERTTNINPHLIHSYGFRDYGDQSRIGFEGVTGKQFRYLSWYNDTHAGAEQFLLMFLMTGDDRWLEVAQKRNNFTRDHGVFWGRRYGVWTSKNEGDGVYSKIFTGPGEPTCVKHSMIDHYSRAMHHGHIHQGALGSMYNLMCDDFSKDTLDLMYSFMEERQPVFFNLTRGADWDSRADGISRRAERDFGWALWHYTEYYRATGDVNVLINCAGPSVQYLLNWIKGDGTGAFAQHNHIMWDLPVNDPRTGSSLLDWSQGTSYWAMTEGMDNSTGSTLQTGTNPWMAGMLIMAILDFYDYDLAEGNASGVNLAEVREMLYQAIRYVWIFGYDAANDYFSYCEEYSTGGGNEGPLLYSLARTYELWRADSDSSSLINSVGTYEQMPNILAFIKSRYQYYLSHPVELKSGGFYGYEIIPIVKWWEVAKRVDAL